MGLGDRTGLGAAGWMMCGYAALVWVPGIPSTALERRQVDPASVGGCRFSPPWRLIFCREAACCLLPLDFVSTFLRPKLDKIWHYIRFIYGMYDVG